MIYGVPTWDPASGGTGSRASAPGGSCGPVASLGMVIRRYLVPRGRAHTPQVVVASSEASAGLRPPPNPREAARAGSLVPARQGSQNRAKVLACLGAGTREPAMAAARGLAARRRPALASEGATTTCGVCVRPRGTKYQRITIPSDATNPQDPPGADARPLGGALARIQGWITSYPLFIYRISF